MGKGKRGETNKLLMSYYRNMATQDYHKIMDSSKINFINNYISFKKTHGCSLTEVSEEEFHTFIVNVNGFFKSKMKQLRKEYLGYTEIKNVKCERQWRMMMGTLRNAYKEGKEMKVTAVLYDMSQAS